MRTVRLLGIATLVLAVAGIGAALFAPLNSSSTCVALTAGEVGAPADPQCETDRSSVFDDEGAGLASALALAVVVPAAVVAIASVSARAGARIALWIGALWLAALVVLSIASVGLIIAPAAIIALATAWFSSRAPKPADAT